MLRVQIVDTPFRPETRAIPGVQKGNLSANRTLVYQEPIYPITLAELGVEVAGSTVFCHSKAGGMKITPVFFYDRFLTETVRLVVVIVTRAGIGLTWGFLVDMI